MADVFLSYAREDEARVGALVRLLEAQRLSVFWDRQIPPGQTWRESIGRALADARCVVVAWSAHSIASDFVAEEADDARRRGLLVPVLIDPVLPPLGFRSVQAADLHDLGSADPPANSAALVDAVRAVLRQHAAQRQPPPQSQSQPQPPPQPLPRPQAPALPRQQPAASGFAVPPAGSSSAAGSSGRPARTRRIGLAAAMIAAIAAIAAAGAWRWLRQPPAPAAPSISEGRERLPSRDGRARPVAPTRVQLLDAQFPESGGTVLRLRLTLGGRSAQTVAARDSFALLRRDGGEEPPADSRPVFETLEPGATIDFVLRFAGTDGVTLRTMLPDGAPIDTPLPPPR